VLVLLNAPTHGSPTLILQHQGGLHMSHQMLRSQGQPVAGDQKQAALGGVEVCAWCALLAAHTEVLWVLKY
jgi:hypothetical protein